MLHMEHQLNSLLHYYFKNKELDELYVSVALKALAVSFIQVFVPIFLYKLGYGIQAIGWYYLVYFFVVVILQPFCMKLNSILGVKKVLSIGTILLALYYYLLNVLSSGNIHYLLVAATFGISVSMYYAAFHIEFARNSDKKKEASEFSMIRIATTLGPLLGALFIDNISFNLLFLLVSGLLILSIVPLFMTKDKKLKKQKLSLKGILGADTWRKGIAYQASGILNISSGVFWPLFIFLTLETVLSLGAIITLTSILMVVFLIMIGRLSDKHKDKVLVFGIISHSFSWISRLSFLSPFGVFLNNFYASITYLAVDLPFAKCIYEGSRSKKNIMEYFLFREVNLELGRIVILLLAILTGSIYWIFVASFFATFLNFVLLKEG